MTQDQDRSADPPLAPEDSTSHAAPSWKVLQFAVSNCFPRQAGGNLKRRNQTNNKALKDRLCPRHALSASNTLRKPPGLSSNKTTSFSLGHKIKQGLAASAKNTQAALFSLFSSEKNDRKCAIKLIK